MTTIHIDYSEIVITNLAYRSWRSYANLTFTYLWILFCKPNLKPIGSRHVIQRFPVPVFSIPIPVLRLSSLGTRFRFRFQDCPWLEHYSESGSCIGFELDSNSGFETAHCTGFKLDCDSETIPSLDLRVLAFRFWFQLFSLKQGLFWVKGLF